MRRLLLCLPLLFVGCKPGRQSAVSDTGLVVSTNLGSGTFLRGTGKIGEEAEDVALSPNGKTVALSAQEATVLWPGGEKIPGMGGRPAWSPDGASLAGVVANNVAVWNAATKAVRQTQTLGIPTAIRWMPDGRVLEVDASGFQLEGVKRVIREERDVLDAVPDPTGAVVWLEAGPTKRPTDFLTVPVFRGRWDPKTGKTTIAKIGRWGTILGTPTATQLTVLSHFALAPDATGYAVVGIAAATNARSLTRLKTLANMEREPTASERKEYWRLSNAALKRNVLALVYPGKKPRVVWCEPIATENEGPTDLRWSPNGQWLVVARDGGTVRIEVAKP